VSVVRFRPWALSKSRTPDRHLHQGAADDLHIDQRLRVRPARLALGELGARVADVDLAARDVVFAAIERGRLREPGDRVLESFLGAQEDSRATTAGRRR
jgi:hypothetical protein